MSKKAYKKVTDHILRLIEESGELPWTRPWNYRGPKNPVSGTEYSGSNKMILSYTQMAKGYGSPRWVTFKQAKKVGGYVRSGETATPVVYWNMIYKKDGETLDDDEIKKLDEEEYETIPFLRHYHVFNLDQCDDVDDLYPDKKEECDWDPVERAESVIDSWEDKPEIKTGGKQAFYRPSEDFINMPPEVQFESAGDYYHVLFHESTHATGHKSRLDRDGVGGSTKDDNDYSREELVAELGAAFMAAETGIDYPKKNNAAYIKGWSDKLREDEKAIVWASGRAGKAVKYITDGG